MNCPVCSYQTIANTTVCPKCQTNIKPLRIVESLSKTQTDLLQEKANFQEQILTYEAKLRKKTNTIGWMTIGFLTFAGLAVLLGYRQYYKSKGNFVQQQAQVVESYEKEEATYQKQITELSEKIHVLEQTQVVRELKYKVKKGDVLHELGELFYNDSDAGIQIALDNKIYDIRGLPIGKTLTIKYRDYPATSNQ